MGLKKVLVALIFFSMFITGCDSTNKEDKTIDEAKQQQTMTKVQHDVNEIMNKDYNYVLDNMGTPYSTTYWIDKSRIDKINNLEEINNGYMAMTYPKYTTDNKIDGSALYIELNNGKVIEVQTFDLESCAINEDDKGDNILVIDKYSEFTELDSALIENINLSSYENENISYLYEDIDDIKPILAIYDNLGENKSIEVYKVKNKNEVLILFLENEILIKTNIISENLITNMIELYFTE